MSNSSEIQKRIAEAGTQGLRLRARKLAQGWSSGVHRATRKGSGVEFAGHRAYFPGDDLRHLDRHALLRHGHLLIREFHTDTERPVHLLVDLTPSMQYRGSSGQAKNKGLESKASRALLLAAVLAFVAKNARDALGLTWINEEVSHTLLPRSGPDAFEQVLHELEVLSVEKKRSSSSTSTPWKKVLSNLGARLPRGTVLFVLSDFLDLDPALEAALTAICTRSRTVRAAQILSPDEVEFPFEGTLKLQNLEGGKEVKTNAESVRKEYQELLEGLTSSLRSRLSSQGGSLIRSITSHAPEESLRLLVSGSGQAQP